MMKQLVLTATLVFFSPSLFLAGDIKRANAELLPQVICDGDSLTVGNGAAIGKDYPEQLHTLLGGATAWDKINLGAGGQGLSDMQDDAVKQVDVLFNSLRPKNICVVWGGLNDIYLAGTGVVAENRLNNYCSGRRAAGFKVIALTMVSSGLFTPTQEQYRQDFNTAARANWTTYADALCDIDVNTVVGGVGTYSNPTYFDPDLVHITAAGYAAIAAAVKTSINSLPSAPSSIPALLVSGAGTPAVNGTYTKRGYLGRDYYNLLGQPSKISTSSIIWNGAIWAILDSAGNLSYYSLEGVTKPSLVITWRAKSGALPAPTVTQSP